MARIRSVHPSLFTDERWVSCSLQARVFYIGLLTVADDQGLFEWKPLQLRMQVLPGDDADVAELLAELIDVDLIAPLQSGGKKLGAIRRFRKFQRPKKPNAIFLLPAEWRVYVGLDDDNDEPEGDEDAPVPPEFPTTPEIAPQMEDGGGKKKELEASLPAATAVATEAEAKPKASRRSDARPIWLADPTFTNAWNACTDQMRKRSESREKTWPVWRAEAAKAGGAETLLATLLAYVRQDEDVKRTGGPGFHIWLKEGRWEHWLDGGDGSSALDLTAFDAERARKTAELERMEQQS